MTISSRTPEGLPSHCPLCGAATNLDFSDPSGDAPCPNCGHLLWKSSRLLAQFQRNFAGSLSTPASEITADTVLDSLRADSLDVVELVMEFEDEFGVTVSDSDYEKIQTVGDAIRYIEERQLSG